MKFLRSIASRSLLLAAVCGVGFGTAAMPVAAISGEPVPLSNNYSNDNYPKPSYPNNGSSQSNRYPNHYSHGNSSNGNSSGLRHPTVAPLTADLPSQNTGCQHHCVGHPSLQERGTLFRWNPCTEYGGPDLCAPLVTDRPDFTEASSTVGRGVAQLEFGYTYTYNSNGGVSERSQSFGEPLLRYGLYADWLELRVGLFPGQQRTTSAGSRNSITGTQDLYLGFKIALTPQAGILPEMAIIPQMTVPTGSRGFTDDKVLPGINWVYSWEINEFVSTAGSTQVNRSVDDGTGRTYLELAQSWTVALTWTEKFGSYAEWYAFFPHDADTASVEHYFNSGFTYLISNDIQWDIRFGRGLNNAADDYFVGTGFSIRFR